MVKKYPDHDKDADTKILYKKSYNSIFTHSRTCSGTSQQTRSSFPRKKLSYHKEYTDGQKIKRDLSIETDFCVLRRRYKYKRNWMSSKAATSAKSRYSNYTEIDTIAEFRDSSACGDKLLGEDLENLRPICNVDLTNMMLTNFKDLLNKWIQNHLIEDKETRDKIEDVFRAVLQGVESRRVQKSSSCTTYVLSKDDEVDNNKKFKVLTDYNGQCCSSRQPDIPSYENFEQSCYTVPIIYKNLRIISTLSIPRNINKRKRNKRRKLGRVKVNRTPNKNLLVSYMRTPPTFLATVSSFNLLAISTKSLIKRCVNFDDSRLKDLQQSKPQHFILFSEPSNKSASASAISIEEVKYKDLKKMKMLMKDKQRLIMSKSLLDKISQKKNEKNRKEVDHCNNTDKVTTCTKNEYADTFKDKKFAIYKANTQISSILNEKDHNEPFVSIELLNQSLEYEREGKVHRFKCEENKNEKKKRPTSKSLQKSSLVCKKSKRKYDRSSSIIRGYEKRKRHNFTYLYKRVNSKTFERDKLLKNMEDIIKYIANLNGGGNIRFEVHLNLGSKAKMDTPKIVETQTTESKFVKPINDRTTMIFTANQTPDTISNVLMQRNIARQIQPDKKSTGTEAKLTSVRIPSPPRTEPQQTSENTGTITKTNATATTITETIQKKTAIANTEKKVTEIIPEMKISQSSTTLASGNDKPKIIPILDGAASQAKYIISNDSIPKENITTDNKVNHKRDIEIDHVIEKDYKQLQTSKDLAPFIDFDLKHEIGELRLAIRDLALTTEKLLNEHYQSRLSTADATINSDTRAGSKKNSSTILDAALHSNSNSVELETTDSKKFSSANATINSTENISDSKKFSSGDATMNSVDTRLDSKEEENEVRIVQYITNASLIKDQTIKATQYSTKMPTSKYKKTETIQAVTQKKQDKGLQNSSQKVSIDLSQEQKKKGPSVLKKHSASYRVIESESIIKVTNMTSNSSESKKQLYYDKALTCSLPKSRSLFEFSMDFTNRDILAYFCDNIKTPLRSAFTYVTPAISDRTRSPSCRSRSESRGGNVINIEEGQSSKSSQDESDRQKSSGSTIVNFQEGYSTEDSRQIKFRRMSVNEAILLCTIIFVPVVIIIVLLYEYVLKDTTTKYLEPPKSTENPDLYIKLSDLGFR